MPSSSFKLYDLSLALVSAVRAPLSAIAHRDPDLARQLRRSCASVPLNVAEGNWRRGGDRTHLWRVASGSAAEVRAALHVAEAFGYVPGAAVAPALRRCEEVLAILWRLTRRGRVSRTARRSARAGPSSACAGCRPRCR